MADCYSAQKGFFQVSGNICPQGSINTFTGNPFNTTPASVQQGLQNLPQATSGALPAINFNPSINLPTPNINLTDNLKGLIPSTVTDPTTWKRIGLIAAAALLLVFGGALVLFGPAEKVSTSTGVKI